MNTSRPASALTRAALAALVVGLVLVGIAAVAGGSAAAYGALLGLALSVGVHAFGSFAVDLVSRVMPGLSLLFALLTYTCQVALLAFVFVAVNSSRSLDTAIDRNWLGGVVIAAALTWSFVQVRLATTARIPAFDPIGRTAPEAGAR